MLYSLTRRHWTCWLCYTIWRYASGLVDYVIQFDDTPLDLLIMLYNLTIRHWACWSPYTIWRYATGLVDYVIQFDDTPLDMLTMLYNLTKTPMDILIMLSNLVISHWTWLLSNLTIHHWTLETSASVLQRLKFLSCKWLLLFNWYCVQMMLPHLSKLRGTVCYLGSCY